MPQIDENVRGADVFVMQTSCAPVHTGIMEMLLMIDALKHASAERITAVLPYFPYVRSDKKDKPRISIAARLMADVIQTAGANRVLTMDLHSPQIAGFFRIPVDHLQAAPIITDYLQRCDLTNHVLIAGDASETKDVGRYANRLELPMAIVDKRRFDDSDTAKAANLIGDVQGKHAIIIDDEVATGGTLTEAATFLKDKGAERITAAFTHAVLSGPAVERLEKSVIERLVFTDTIPLPGQDLIKVRGAQRSKNLRGSDPSDPRRRFALRALPLTTPTSCRQKPRAPHYVVPRGFDTSFEMKNEEFKFQNYLYNSEI